MNKKLEIECKQEALFDFNNWKFCFKQKMIYDPSAVRWLRVVFAPDPKTCIDIEQTRNLEFKRLQKEYLKQIHI